jgi:ribosomal protein S18 acetylase RimI-like enzyme
LKIFHQAVNTVFNFMDDVEVYQVLRQARSFHPELDLIILSEDGDVAALASVWFDGGLGLAEFEPVATVPEFRKLGLGTAIIQEACNRLVTMGCQTLSVHSWNESIAANKLYEGAGLRPKAVKNYWKLLP